MNALGSRICLLHTSESQPASTTPMNTLPVELLIDIFIYCAHSAAITPLTLGRVCRRWRAITENDARMFQLIVLDDSKLSLAASNQASHTFLQRSKALEFDVDVQLSSRDSLLPILSPFLSSLPRWRSFTLHGIRHEHVRFHRFWCPDAGKPKLEQLEISVLDPADIDDMTEQVQTQTDADDSFTGAHAGTFRPYTISLTSNLLCMDIMLTKLPSPAVLVPLHFVSLFITEGSLSLNVHPSDLLHFLTACPMLEYFSFNGIMMEPTFTEADLQVPPPVARLPHLRSLVLHSTLCTRIILSHIDTPALKELYLEHLNVDFAFPVHNPYLPHRPHPTTPMSVSASPPISTPPPAPPDMPNTLVAPPESPPPLLAPSFPSMFLPSAPSQRTYEVEDGDSDDEWPDFSQSPYSDHATGMGVRSLLRRSNPPLRVLEMDYADMRTKDFRWLFARARDLEDFRIVASDMADRVIEMLAPRLVRMAPDARGPVAAEGPDGTCYVHHVQLPRLKSVELFNCQRLSGAAIVQAIAQRALVTDGLARHGSTEFAPLEDVAVVQCSRFNAEHGAELGATLGERLRFH